MPVSTKIQVPALGLDREFLEIRQQFFRRLEEIGARGRFVLGEPVEIFERHFAAFLGLPAAAGLNSGTDALILSLRALGVGPGDQVLTTPFTFVSTVSAIRWVGAAPVFSDIDPDTYCLDPHQAAKALGPKTRVILPVHLYGHPAEMDAFAALTGSARSVSLLEDCAQALGARYRERLVGTLGTLAAFSFYPTKVLGAYGDAGAVVSRDPALCERVRELRNHGQDRDGSVRALGLNSRLDGIQAVLLDLKLEQVERDIARRIERAERYIKLLSQASLHDVKLPSVRAGARHVFQQFVIRTQRRDELHQHLRAAGVESRIYYGRPVHLEPLFHDLGYREGRFPAAEEAARRVLALPLFPQLTDEEQDYVVKTLAAFFRP